MRKIFLGQNFRTKPKYCQLQNQKILHNKKSEWKHVVRWTLEVFMDQSFHAVKNLFDTHRMTGDQTVICRVKA